MDTKVVKREVAYVIRDLTDALVCREDIDYAWQITNPLEKALKGIMSAISVADASKNKPSEEFCEFGSNFHTFLRKGCDGDSDTLLYKMIRLYDSAWSELLYQVERWSKEWPKKSKLEVLHSFVKSQSNWDKVGDCELRCAFRFFFLENPIEEITKTFDQFCEN